MTDVWVRAFRESLSGGGECGRLVASLDWSATPLGPIEAWTRPLMTATSIVLRSPVPMVMLWGEDGIMLYNDAYSTFARGRHPELLGSKVREGWPEVANFNDNVMRVGLAGGTLTYKDKELTLYRHGRPEQVWMDLDYSPVLDEGGRPAGVLCVLAETTERVQVTRRLRETDERQAFLLKLADALRLLTDPVGVQETAARLLRDRLDLGWCYYVAYSEDAASATIHRDAVREGLTSLVGRYDLSDVPEFTAHLRSGRSLDIPDIAAHALANPTLVERYTRLGMRSIAAVPLVKAGGLTALLVIADAVPRVWAPSTFTLIEEVAQRTWAAVERARAETRLRESEARFRTMADAVPQIVWIADADGRAEFFNRQWTDYTGTPYDPATAAPVSAIQVHPDDVGATAAAFDEARCSGRAYQIEHRLCSASGGYRWFLVRAEPYRDPATGAVVRWFGASVDIHDRKLAEEALRALNADLEREVVERTRERGLIWQHSLDQLSVIDMGTATFDAVNPAWTAALGWSASEIENRPFTDFVHPDDLSASMASLDRMRQGYPVLKFENRYRTRDGGWRWLSWAAVPEGGKLYSITRDVTAEKERQAELEAAQEALRQSQKMEAMGQLTGGVAHDFNNLLTPIVGSLDMLQRRGLGSEREQRLIAGAVQSAERAKTLVQRLLAFARRQPLQSVPVDIAKLVTGMGDLVASTTGPQIKVVVEAPEGLPPAMADPNQLEMALLNLSVNARDAMPEGGTLRISASAERISAGHPAKLRPGTYIRLSVADTGAGMDEATRARAVEPFFSTKGVGKGTGLGLSMVHGLASQLSGALTITSRPELGTNVELWLPQSTAALEAAEAAPPSPDATLMRGTALLVDDEDLVRMSTADMLSELGYAVIEAATGEEAMRLVGQGDSFDLLVTDHLMPGITGTDLARAIQGLRPDVPVLIVSGYAESDGLAADLPRLTKPFRKDELASSLAQISGL